MVLYHYNLFLARKCRISKVFHLGLKLEENRGYSNVSFFFHALAYSPNTENTSFSNG